MSNTVKCPRCASSVDVTSFAPGSTVRCSDCGSMMRVPTGRTGVHVAVKDKTSSRPGTAAVAAASAPQKQRETSTRVRAASAEKRESGTRMRQAAVGRPTQARPKKSPTGLYVGLGILALALIIGGALFFLGGPKVDPPEAPTAKAPAPKPMTPKPPPAPAPAAVDPTPPPPPPPPPPSGDEAARTRWQDILIQLRGGGGFDVPGRPEQVYFDKVQKMGKSAYPHLIRFIDNDDTGLGRAAVALLNALTNQKQPLPNEATRAKLKADWEAWLKANP